MKNPGCVKDKKKQNAGGSIEEGSIWIELWDYENILKVGNTGRR